MDEKDLSKLDRWLDNLAAEVVLAEPETDHGLLPIRELFANLRDKTAGEPSLQAFHASAAGAVAKIEAVMDDRALFSAADLDFIQTRIKELKELRLPTAVTLSESSTEALAAPATPSHSAEENDKTLPMSEEPQPEPTVSTAPEPAPKVEAPVEEMPLLLDENMELDLIKEFFTESQEHLENIEQGALVLEENPTHKETLDSIFRAFHSFKGAAGFLNLRPMNRLAHELESLLDLVRNGKRTVNAALIDLMLKGGDMLRDYVVELREQVEERAPRAAIVKPVGRLILAVRRAIEDGEPAPVAVTPEAAPSPSLPEAAPAPVAETPGEETGPGSLSRPIDEPNDLIVEQPVAKKEAEPAAVAASKSNSSVVKIDTAKLDSLVDLVGEMVITQSMVAQDPDLRAVQCPRLTRNMAQLGRIVQDLQRTAMAMRMVPIRATFQKMNRLVRDLASKCGKQVELKLSGEDTELDRTIIEEIGDPLIHMIRNSIDHGIERPEVRLANGKPSTGILHLNAFHQGGNIVIQITDDGAGLNEEKILAKAREKGIVHEKQELTKKEIFGLIFAAGFSTADKVSDLSGRGVGMDVVKSNIEKLRGKVAVDSTPGKGAVFTIYLPLTLAIIDGLIVAVGDQHYILPTLSVKESFRPQPEMISTVHERGEMVNVRGHLSPLLRLYDLFSIRPKSENPEDSIIIVVESGNQQRCLMVDDLVGKQEIVIKSLGDAFKRNRALSGASILGDGRVGLILDVSSLVSLRDRNDPTTLAN